MISRSRYPADSVNEAPVFSRLPVDIEPLDRLRQLRRGDGEVLRGRRELAERRNLLLRGRRRLLGAVRRGLGDPRDLLHAPHDLANAARLPFRLARERGRELHGGVQVATAFAGETEG